MKTKTISMKTPRSARDFAVANEKEWYKALKKFSDPLPRVCVELRFAPIDRQGFDVNLYRISNAPGRDEKSGICIVMGLGLHAEVDSSINISTWNSTHLTGPVELFN